MDKLIAVVGEALDIVEGELLGASTYHGKRIAALCAAMGRRLGMDQDRLITLSCCALLHDNALTEYIQAEHQGGYHDPAMKLHCEYGQRNVKALGFPGAGDDLILYHHERIDGSGPFGKRAGEYSLDAELVGVADAVDVSWHLQRRGPEELPEIGAFIKESGMFRGETANLLMEVLDRSMLAGLRDESINATMENLIPPWEFDSAAPSLPDFTVFISRVIDYKSSFTCRHSSGIVEKALLMADHYGYELSTRNRLCLAANLHDIGKLAIPEEILEKPGKLSDEEFRILKGHAQKTSELLAGLEGLDDVREWASNHHEKLDGSGYCRGKKAAELDFNSRLMTCLDIYQGVSEKRPYHPARDHRETMVILREMVESGALDGGIVGDLDRVLGEGNPATKGPPPCLNMDEANQGV
jgi:HD-GYP domain-containing protein (c-di-GMP phosphodiesterase class II)